MQLSDYLFLLLSADNVVDLRCNYDELLTVSKVLLTVFGISVYLVLVNVLLSTWYVP
jgi:hypothetical protein